MRKFLFFFLLGFVLISCKKDTKIPENGHLNPEDSAALPDSADYTSGTSNPFQLGPLHEQADIGKTVFTSGGNTIISFDTQAHTGKIKIEGKEYRLNHLEFSENNYDITGNGISITASEGNFQDMVSDCMYGVFPEITVTFNGKKSVYRNIKVQDCPNYN